MSLGLARHAPMPPAGEAKEKEEKKKTKVGARDMMELLVI